MSIQDQQEEIQQITKIKTILVKQYSTNSFIQKISFMIIRPPRVLYNQQLLKLDKINGKKFHSRVQYIPFPLSIYEPSDVTYMILYLHGNSSNRLEGFNELKKLPQRVGLACFDFNGCGNRIHKRFISLGKHESVEVDIAYNYLKEKGYTVICWGRSMGSVSALLSESCDIIVADSPFSSLKTLCKQFSQSNFSFICKIFVKCIFPLLFCVILKYIQEKADIKFDDFQLLNTINNKKRSIIFLSGMEDNLISCRHTQALYQAYKGRKKMFLFEGDHNSQRPLEIVMKVHQQIEYFLDQQKKSNLNVSSPSDKQRFFQSREQLNTNHEHIEYKCYSQGDCSKKEDQKQIRESLQLLSTSLMLKQTKFSTKL